MGDGCGGFWASDPDVVGYAAENAVPGHCQISPSNVLP